MNNANTLGQAYKPKAWTLVSTHFKEMKTEAQREEAIDRGHTARECLQLELVLHSDDLTDFCPLFPAPQPQATARQHDQA